MVPHSLQQYSVLKSYFNRGVDGLVVRRSSRTRKVVSSNPNPDMEALGKASHITVTANSHEAQAVMSHCEFAVSSL